MIGICTLEKSPLKTSNIIKLSDVEFLYIRKKFLENT